MRIRKYRQKSIPFAPRNHFPFLPRNRLLLHPEIAFRLCPEISPFAPRNRLLLRPENFCALAHRLRLLKHLVFHTHRAWNTDSAPGAIPCICNTCKYVMKRRSSKLSKCKCRAYIAIVCIYTTTISLSN